MQERGEWALSLRSTAAPLTGEGRSESVRWCCLFSRFSRFCRLSLSRLPGDGEQAHDVGPHGAREEPQRNRGAHGRAAAGPGRLEAWRGGVGRRSKPSAKRNEFRVILRVLARRLAL